LDFFTRGTTAQKNERQLNWKREQTNLKLSVEEEDLVLKAFLAIFPKVYNEKWNFSERVWVVALTYFRRFFVVNSVMDYDLKQTLFTCVLLATKVEEERRHDNKTLQFMKRQNQEVNCEAVSAMEYVVLDTLQFQLEVFSPYIPLYGFCIDVQNKLSSNDSSDSLLSLEQLASVKSHAEGLLHRVVLTEALILFPPSLLALTALRQALVEHSNAEEIWNRYVVLTFGKATDWPSLVESMNEIQKYFNALEITQENRDEIKLTNEKLKRIPKV
jgi:cyclin H